VIGVPGQSKRLRLEETGVERRSFSPVVWDAGTGRSAVSKRLATV
jgi:hypothetical protein